MKKTIILLSAIALFIGCKPTQDKSSSSSKEMNELVNIMQGSYSSEKQSIVDTSYFNISLRMVPIWKNKGHYLYVEQAMFKKQEKPYRVRIYKLTQKGDEFISEIHTLKDEKSGRLVGLAIWDSKEQMIAQRSVMMETTKDDDFDLWEEGEMEGFFLNKI